MPAPAKETDEEDTDPNMSGYLLPEEVEEQVSGHEDDEVTGVDDVDLLAGFDSLSEDTDPAAGQPVEDELLAVLMSLDESVEDSSVLLELKPEAVVDTEAEPDAEVDAAMESEADGEAEPMAELEDEEQDDVDLLIEIEEASGLLSLSEGEKKPVQEPELPAPSRTRVHEPEGRAEPNTEVGSSLVSVSIPARLQWNAMTARASIVQIAPNQLRASVTGIHPDLFTRVRVQLSPEGRKKGDVSLWANATRVRADDKSPTDRVTVTLSLAPQNAREDLRKYRSLVQRSRD